MSKKIFLTILCVLVGMVLIGGIARADKAVQVGNQLVVTLAMVLDPDAEKTNLIAWSPEITYNGEWIKYKPDYAYLGGTGEQISGNIRWCIKKDNIVYAYGNTMLLPNHDPEILFYDPAGEGDVNPGFNTALKAIITPGSKIRIGILVSSNGEEFIPNSLLFYAGTTNNWGPAGTVGVANNLLLTSPHSAAYQTFKIKGTYLLKNAQLSSGRNSMVW